MKKTGKSILFFSGIRENDYESLEQKPNWTQKIAGICFQMDFDEILSTFSIPVLVIIISFLLSYSAHGQENGKLRDYFESPTDLEEPQDPIPASTEPAVGNRVDAPVEHSIRTYQLPSGGTVREYRGEGGMLIRESNWGPAYGSPMQPVYAQPAPQPVYSQPTQQPVYAQPTQQPVYAQPTQQPVYSQPTQQPVYSQPTQQPVYSQPTQQPVYTQPTQQPVYSQPTQQPVYAQPTPQPIAEKRVRHVVLPATIQLDEELPGNELNPEIKSESEVVQDETAEEAISPEEPTDSRLETIDSLAETEETQIKTPVDSDEMMLDSETEVKTGAELATVPQNEAEKVLELPIELESESETEPVVKSEDAMQTVVHSNSERSLKTWDETGLIPQDWTETEEIAIPEETEVAQNSMEDSYELPVPKNMELESSEENLELSTKELVASSESESEHNKKEAEMKTARNSEQTISPSEVFEGENEQAKSGFEVVEISDSPTPLMATPADLDSTTREVDQLLYETAFNTAVSAIKSPSETIEAPQLNSISESEFEENWENAASEKAVRQTTHTEIQPNSPVVISTIATDLGLQSQTSKKTQEEIQDQEQTAEEIPQKIRRLKGKPSEKLLSSMKKETKRFQFGVSTSTLEAMISTGEEDAEIPATESSIELNTPEMSEVVAQMNQAPEIAFEGGESHTNSGNAAEMKASAVNLFDFGIEDMELFNENVPLSSKGKTEAIQPEFSDSASMSTTEEEVFENGDVISPSESTSTVSAIYYENCKNRRVIQKVTYEATDSSASTVQTEEESEAEGDAGEDAELNLDFLLLPPDEFESKSMEEMHEEAKTIAISEDSSSEAEDSVPALLDSTEEEIGSVGLPPVPVQNEDEMESLVPSDSIGTEEEFNILEMESENEIREIPSRQNQEMVSIPDRNTESESQEPAFEQTEMEQQKAERRKASSRAADLVLGIKPSETTESQTKDSTESLSTETTASRASESAGPQSTESAVPRVNESTDEVSSLLADQIADRIAERVVERTVEEVLKRMKVRLDEEAAARAKIEAAAIAEAGIRAKEEAVLNQTSEPEASESNQTSEPETSESNQTSEPVLASQISETARPTKLARPARPMTMENSDENSVPEEVESLDTLQETSEKSPVMRLAAERGAGNQPESETEPVEPMLQNPNSFVGNSVSESDIQNESLQASVPTVSEVPQVKETPGFVKLGGRNRKKNFTVSESKVSESKVSESKVSESTAEVGATSSTLVQAPPRVEVLPQAPAAEPVSAQAPVLAQAAAPVSAPAPVPASAFSKAEETTPPVTQMAVSSEGERKEKELQIHPCEGLVLNISSPIKQISITDPQFCDYIDLGRNQVALIGKFCGETKVQIEFADSRIPAMLFHVTVHGTDSSALTLVNWSHEVENQLNATLGEKSISIFLFQNRIFVKGNLKGMIEPAKLIAAVQKDFVQMKKANPNLVIPGLAGEKHKMVLVNMLTTE